MRKIHSVLLASAAIGYANAKKDAGQMPADVLAATTTDAEKPAVTNIVTLDVAFPTSRGGGQAPKYPFDTLDVGALFGVKNKTKRQMANSVSQANKKYRTEILGAEGTAPIKNQTRHFIVTDVTDAIAAQIKGTELEGSTVLVKRDK